MNFKLIGKLILNKKPEGTNINEDIEHFIKDANSTLLTKGAPENMGAKVSLMSIKEDHIKVTITSGRYVRPHEALMRLKKNFGIQFGKK